MRLLTGLMDDPNVAVIEAATEVLASSGESGLRIVLEQLARNDDNAGYYIRDRLVSLWAAGHLSVAEVTTILAEDSRSDAGEGAAEVLELLRGL